MNNLALRVASELLPLLKKKYDGDYSNISSVKVFWHNLIFLTFSKVNCLYLSENKLCTLSDFVSLGILPKTVELLEIDNSALIGNRIDEIANEIFQSNPDLSKLRECILGVELFISKTEIKIREGKVLRDTTGSYYTPSQLAKAVVYKAFDTKQAQNLITEKNKNLKIADLSCGGGEFFWATQDYMKNELQIPFEESALCFWGMDIDPIALQITICRLLRSANASDWKEIASHFHLGNPLLSTDKEGNYDLKNTLFALNRFYASEMGINYSSTNQAMEYDIILGNPPWEKTRFEERKFFACYAPDIAFLSKKNEREQAISNLEKEWIELFNWVCTISSDYKTMCSKSYNHPLITKAVSGELNTYSMFTELAYELLSDKGICSLIVKSTLATAPTHKGVWEYLLKQKALLSLYFFENKNKIFNIDSREKFAVITLSKVKQVSFSFSAGLQMPEDLNSCSDVIVNHNDIFTINPFTNMLPNVARTDDFRVLLNIHRRLELFQEVYPNCHFGRLIHLTAHAKQIDMIQTENNVPIYEGKFIEQYDARYSTFAGLPDDKKYAAKAVATKNIETDGIKPLPESRFFVQKELWNKYKAQYSQTYSLCWRSLTSPSNARTTIAMILPTCPTCQSIQMLQTEDNSDLLMLLALFNSLPFDYFVRLKMPGLDLTQSVIRQIPVPSKERYEKIIQFNDKTATLGTHILSCAYHLLKNESLLSGLLNEFKDRIYLLDATLPSSIVKKMLDRLFAQAYQLDEQMFSEIRRTFPKY